MSENTKAAQAAADEATGKNRSITVTLSGEPLVLDVPRKWKRFRFLRALSRGDLGAALESVWAPVKGEEHPTITLLDDADLSEEEFTAILEAIAEQLGGTDLKNS